MVDITQNGMANTELDNLTIIGNSGTQVSFGKTVGFENINFN